MAALKNYWRRLSVGSAWGPTPVVPTDELSKSDCDILFTWQQSGQDFGKLTAQSLLKSGICDNEFFANRTLKACHNIGIIDSITGRPNTSIVDRNIVNKLAILSIAKQRKLVNLLFFWEEELVRWRLLTEEEVELTGKLASASDLSDNERIYLEEALKVTSARKRVLPSLREQSENVQSSAVAPPSYQA